MNKVLYYQDNNVMIPKALRQVFKSLWGLGLGRRSVAI